MLPVFGRSGDIPLDENAYENTVLPLKMYLKASSEEEMYTNRARLMDKFDNGGYVDFIPYFDCDKIYSIMLTARTDFTSNRIYRFNEIVEMEFTVKPFKYYLGTDSITMESGDSIYNMYTNESLPIIKLTGTGDSTLTLNGKTFVVKNIQSYISIDSQVQNSYKEISTGLINENDKIFTLDYPKLKKGNNTISWTGSITAFEIQPRWWTLI